jgi:ABC-type proline/glycine betaine transport system permease subunit
VLEELFHVQLAAALVCAAIYCGVYAAYVWASVRLRRTQGGPARTFTNRIPAGAQMAMVVLLIGLGASLLFAEHSVVGLTLALFGVVVGGCAVAANFVAWRRASGATRAAMAAGISGSGGDAR